MEEDREVTPGGSEVFHHDAPVPASGHGAEADLDAVQGHVERHIGPIHRVFHELVSPYVHLDVLQVAPSAERPAWTLVTCGTSALPMAVEPGVDAPRFIELLIVLPADWKVGDSDERWYWPVRLLKQLGRLPHEYGTWLGVGHTMPNGDPAEPYAPGTQLSGAILLPPLLAPEAFEVLARPEGDIHFLAVVPLYAEEMDFKLQHGAQALVDAWDAAGLEVTEALDPARPGLGRRRRKRFGLF